MSSADSSDSPRSRPANVPDPGEATDKTTVLVGETNTLRAELQKAKEQEACFIMIRGTPQGHRFFLTRSEMTMGRDQAADIVLADQGVSRKHAKVTKEGEKVKLTDLKSSNGTFLNDKKIPSGGTVSLSKEDMVRVGNSILKFLPKGELEILFYGNLDTAAHSDPLTRIYNKGYLLEALDAEFKRAKALHNEFCLLFFDLDHFKKVNDTYGHDGGDFVLKEFTSMIKTGHLRPKDIFARYGGEEFVVLLANTNSKEALDLGERIRAAVETHAFIYEGKRIPITTSIGIAELTTEVESPQTLIKAADKALYSSKSNGRNRVSLA